MKIFFFKAAPVFLAYFLLLAYFLQLPVGSFAQTDSCANTKYKVAIFAPLYFDSAFNYGNEYRYTKNVFPKFINPGLEFYEGAQLRLILWRKKAGNWKYIYMIPGQLENRWRTN